MERNFFRKETIEERIRKYTRPHPIVTSHLRNLQQPYQNTSPSWVRPYYRGVLPSPSMPNLITYPIQATQPLLMSPIIVPTFQQRQLTPQHHQHHQQQQNNRKRRNDSPLEYFTQSGKKKKEQSHVSHQPPSKNSKFAKLASDILDFADKNTQTDELLQKKLELRSALLCVFRRQFPGASLHLVGSSCNGFAGPKSDADFCLMLTHNRSIDQKYEACSILRQLQKALRLLASIKKILLIRAKVPILKFEDTISGCECDVNINNSIGIRNTHLLRSYSKYDNRLVPLVVIIKHWAKSKSINDASCGTLSSYSIVLMVIHYLQSGCKPPVLISLQKEHPNYFNMQRSVDDLPQYEPIEVIKQAESQNRKCVGELLCGFFEYYASVFQFDYHAASVRLGRVVPKNMNGDFKNKFICIEEPFDLTNTARAVYDFGKFLMIKEEFKKAYKKMQENPSIYSIIS